MMLFTSENAQTVVVKQISRLPDRCLTVAFRESVPPVLWQLGLGQNQNTIVVLRQDGDLWSIGLAGDGDAFTIVARFDNRSDAEEAFAAVQKAFMQGRPFFSYPVWRWVGVILVVLGMIIFGGIVFGPSPAAAPKASLKAAAQQALSAGEPEKGVPQVADDVLKNPESPFGMLMK